MKVLIPTFSPRCLRSSWLTAPRLRIQFPFSTRERSASHSAHTTTFTCVAFTRRAMRRASSVCANSGRMLGETRTRRIASGVIRFGSSWPIRRVISSIMSSTSSKKSTLSCERRISSSTWLGEAGCGRGGGGAAGTRTCDPETDVTGRGPRGAGVGAGGAASGGAAVRYRRGTSVSVRCLTSPPLARRASDAESAGLAFGSGVTGAGAGRSGPVYVPGAGAGSAALAGLAKSTSAAATVAAAMTFLTWTPVVPARTDLLMTLERISHLETDAVAIGLETGAERVVQIGVGRVLRVTQVRPRIEGVFEHVFEAHSEGAVAERQSRLGVQTVGAPRAGQEGRPIRPVRALELQRRRHEREAGPDVGREVVVAQVKPPAHAERRAAAVAALPPEHVLAADRPDPQPAGHLRLAQERPADREPVAGQPRSHEPLEGDGVGDARRLRRVDPLLY